MAMHTFGWGRRTCLGKDIVDDEMFVCGAAIVWGFDLGPKVCPRTGKVIPIDTQATNSHVILEPSPFQISINVRNSDRAKDILDGYHAVREECRVEI